MPSYHPRAIEPRWQQYWEIHKTFRCPDPDDPSVAGKPKIYLLDMFPYPSGSGLHVGHPEGYTATDILSRFKRMQGFHVLHPMGWDAFGLPAEQYAIQTGTHPRITTQKNISTFRRQIKSLGFSYDWDREVDTTDPGYFRWTQWIFLQLFDTWYDLEAKRGRPINELPIPSEIHQAGEAAVHAYRDEHRLAYQSEAPVNWCPALGTVLANEEVIDGRSERGNHPVERRPLRQWMLRITAYAERLLEDLEQVAWPESIKEMQRNWIGKSEGAEVDFSIVGHEGVIRVFTTRPDTLFGATYMVLSPEHTLVPTITTATQRQAVEEYQKAAANKSERERTELAKKKTGVATGAYAINPVNQAEIPIWIADYVLAGYGTGAIMAVPGHDERDFEFAKAFDLPIVTVVKPTEAWLKQTGSTLDNLTEAYAEVGEAMHSGEFDGLPTSEAKSRIITWLEERGIGSRRIHYKLRDWLFSRQRYWGEPFPILHEVDTQGQRTGVTIPLPESALPLRLPELEDFAPTGNPEGPIIKATDWIQVEHDGKRYRRETNTMPQWAGSCWYYLRYIDPHNDQRFADPDKLKYWLPVDLYVGGAEHAVLHLLYARFWHKVLYDRGHVPCAEPFQRLVNQGMILGETEYHAAPEMLAENEQELHKLGVQVRHIPAKEEGDKDQHILFVTTKDEESDSERVVNLPDELIEKRQGKTFLKGTKLEMIGRAEKMSKSRGNVINPDDVVDAYGADSLRLYEMFMGPLEATKPWNMRSVEGVYRFLSRVWRIIVDESAEEVQLNATVSDTTPNRDTLRHLHRTIEKVTHDTEHLRFNTAIAAMMEFSNHLNSLSSRPRSVLDPFVKLLAPYAPHIAEELWHALGNAETLAYASWPEYDPELTKADAIEVPVQINGKLRAKLTVPPETDQKTLESLALDDAKVQEQIAGKTVRKVIVVPGKLVNLVVG